MKINPKHESGTVTIQMIAKLANVSHTTVSRALNGSDSVKPVTKKKIVDLANELGYVPNYSARRLVTSRSDTIGIFFSDLETGTSASFLTEVIEQAQRMLPKQYSLSINSIRTAWESGKVSVSNFDGVIVISQSREDQQFIDQIKQQGIPTVILNRKVEGGILDNYAFNDFLGEQMATEYAIRMGHRKFALIKGVNSFESSYQRTMGFQKALANHQIEIDPAMIKEGDYFPESGNRLMRQILSSGQVPTCVICENDDMAIGALNACSDLGYRVPEDISLIGFDDMSYSKYLTPSLTTVRKLTAVLVKKGIERLTQLIQGETFATPVQEVINPEVIVRASVKRLARGESVN